MVIGLFFAVAFWSSLALSSLLALIGVWRANRWFLVAGALVSIPFVFITIAHPGTRYFAAIPLLHLLAAIAVKGYPRWISWMFLVIILSLGGLFLLVLFGLI
jgi:hypothetical protein